eukprot:Skav235718  [mRNA]  locus=scaffold280:599859:606755:+ [translate_table: standard]
MTWNTGGLSSEAWDLFQVWLSDNPFDLVMLQETHWSFTQEWTIKEYWCIHSGHSSRRGGLLTLISKRLCPHTQISWVDTIPGHLTHIRLHRFPVSYDILNCYQHTCIPSHRDDRHHFWKTIRSILIHVPDRNLLCIGGDFNTSLTQPMPGIGLGTYLHHDRSRRTGPLHDDADMFMTLITDFHLTVVNSWNATHGPTFCNQDGSSRIDFILTKTRHTDQAARSTQVLLDHPLIPLTGPRHFPIIAWLRIQWHFTGPSVNTSSQQMRTFLLERWRQDPGYMTQLQDTVQRHLHTLSPQHILHDFTTFHTELFHCIPPLSRAPPKPDVPIDLPPIQRFTHHTRVLNQMRNQNLISPFHAWFHIAQRSLARKAMRKSAQHRRRARVHRVMTLADEAASAHDHFTLYKCIRQLSPKQSYRRVQLRSSQGQLLDPSQAADDLATWIQDLYHSQTTLDPPASVAWPFSCEDLAEHLAALPPTKALDPTCVPAPVWIQSASDIAQFLHPLIVQWSTDSHMSFPEVWSSGRLVFLHKPGKKGSRPEDLRPIALLEPTVKVVMGLIAQELLFHAGTALRAVPQFAYQAARGCGDAIHRLATHCRKVRHILEQHKLKHHRHSLDSPSLFGGLLFSLDLSKAFDRVDREKLLSGMLRLGIPEHLIHLLATIYRNTTFTFEYQGQYRTVPTHQGIRQGCKAAPCCWALFITDLLHTLITLTNQSWVLHDNTIYADDWVSHNLITSPEQLHLIVKRIGLVLDLLEESGMQPNIDKTRIMLSLGGSALSAITKRYIRRTHHGAFLCIPRAHGTSHIKLVAQISYLGIQLHYRRIEAVTMNSRLQSAKTATALLHKWLFTRHPLRLQHRIRVWRQCILPCHWYGLFQVGFHQADIIRLDQQWMRQLRGITHTPAHLTHISNHDLLNRYAIPDPLLQLRQLGLNLKAAQHRRRHTLHPTDILHHQPPCQIDHLVSILDLCLQVRRTPTCTIADLDPGWTCTHCGLSFSSQSQLVKHLTTSHDLPQGSLRAYRPTEARAGEPTCTRCGHQFTTWHALKYHTQFVCALPRQDIDLTMDPVHHLHVELRRFLAANLYNLHVNRGICDQLAHCCCLCFRLCEGEIGLFRRWGKDHPDEWSRHGLFMDQIEQASIKATPCVYCNNDTVLTHQCIVHRQLAMLLAHDRPSAPMEVANDRMHQCHCGKAYVTAHGLKQHQDRVHSQTSQVLTPEDRELILTTLVTDDWSDVLDNQRILTALTTGCLLCEQKFSKRPLLTRHLRQEHATQWNEAVIQAYQLEDLYKEAGTCYCDPQLPGKHSCVIFQQLALLQRHWTDTCQQNPPTAAPDQVEPAPLRPPDFRLMLEVALKLGSVDVLLQSRIFKDHMSTRCILCNAYFATFAELMYHHETQHPNAWQDRQPFLTLLLNTFYHTKGCTCWPAVTQNVDHVCVTLAQIAVVAGQMTDHFLLPYRFSEAEHAHMLPYWLDKDQHDQVLKWLLTRDFDALIKAEWLHAHLQTGCVMCDQAFLADDLAMHVWNHHVTLCKHSLPVMTMMAEHLMTIVPDHHCPLCHMPLEENTTQALFDHLQTFCPVILQLSYLLTLPNHEHPPYEDRLPPPKQRRRQVHQRQLTLVDGMAGLLDKDKHHLVTTWLKLIQHIYVEPALLQLLTHQCWHCHQLFISSDTLIRHLNMHHGGTHSQTRTCLDNLAQDLPSHDLCTWCCSQAHPGDKCPVLLQLATLLCDGGRGSSPFWSHVSGNRGVLETHHSSGAAEAHVGIRKRSCGEPAQEDQNQTSKRTRSRTPPVSGTVPADDPVDAVAQQTSCAPRRLIERTALRATVPDPLQNWHPGHPAQSLGSHPNLEQNQLQDDAAAPSPGSHHHRVDDREARVLAQTGHTGGDQGNGAPAEHHRSGGENAISSVEPEISAAGAYPESDGHPREPGSEGTSFPDEGHAGRGDHSSLPCSQEDTSEPGQPALGPLDMDHFSGATADDASYLAQTVLSCRLATHRSQMQTPESRTLSSGERAPGQDHGELWEGRQGKRSSVRVLMNPHATCCFANAPMLGLTWQTLLLSDTAEGGWLQGQQLFDQLTAFTLSPFYLVEDAEFRAVLRGHWEEFDTQLDAIEFTDTMLLQFQPKHLSNAWTTQTAMLGLAQDTALEAIKSPALVPIQLNVFAVRATSCPLHRLIDIWHDATGHPKGLLQRSHSVILSLPRTADDARALVVTDCAADFVLPYFAGEPGQLQFQVYTPIAITFHVGSNALQGHFRTALRTGSGWKAYEDGRAPDLWPSLQLPHGAQVILIWALRQDHWMRVQPNLLPDAGSATI